MNKYIDEIETEQKRYCDILKNIKNIGKLFSWLPKRELKRANKLQEFLTSEFNKIEYSCACSDCIPSEALSTIATESYPVREHEHEMTVDKYKLCQSCQKRMLIEGCGDACLCKDTPFTETLFKNGWIKHQL